jgi:type II secretory pathway pseudopilin PulG
LTLLELIVALGILAVLSTIAVQALDPLADQARYEATQRLLNDLRLATVGSTHARHTDGQPLVTGLLADTGG